MHSATIRRMGLKLNELFPPIGGRGYSAGKNVDGPENAAACAEGVRSKQLVRTGLGPRRTPPNRRSPPERYNDTTRLNDHGFLDPPDTVRRHARRGSHAGGRPMHVVGPARRRTQLTVRVLTGQVAGHARGHRSHSNAWVALLRVPRCKQPQQPGPSFFSWSLTAAAPR